MSPIAARALERARQQPAVSAPEQKTRLRRFWTTGEEARLKTLYPATPMPEMIKLFGRPDRAIYSKAKLLGLRRCDEYLASEHACRLRRGDNTGEATRFQKGGTSWNKGLHFVSGGRSAETQFNKGNLPHNHVPVGTEVMGTDGYLKVKVSEPNQWEWTHRRNWEAAHGPIAKGLALVFKDRNRTNCDVDNLELLTRSQLMLRNTIHRYPPELKDTIRQLGKFNKAIETAREKQND